MLLTLDIEKKFMTEANTYLLYKRAGGKAQKRKMNAILSDVLTAILFHTYCFTNRCECPLDWIK